MRSIDYIQLVSIFNSVNLTSCKREKKIQFVKAGEKRTPTQKSLLGSYLDGAINWKLMSDLDGNLKFPILTKNMRPDMTLMSDSTKKIDWIKLTVPSKERVEEKETGS